MGPHTWRGMITKYWIKVLASAVKPSPSKILLRRQTQVSLLCFECDRQRVDHAIYSRVAIYSYSVVPARVCKMIGAADLIKRARGGRSTCVSFRLTEIRLLTGSSPLNDAIISFHGSLMRLHAGVQWCKLCITCQPPYQRSLDV